MAPASKRSLQSLQKVIEDASPEALREFFCQEDRNFSAIAAETAAMLKQLEERDTEEVRESIKTAVLELMPEIAFLSRSRRKGC